MNNADHALVLDVGKDSPTLSQRRPLLQTIVAHEVSARRMKSPKQGVKAMPATPIDFLHRTRGSPPFENTAVRFGQTSRAISAGAAPD